MASAADTGAHLRPPSDVMGVPKCPLFSDGISPTEELRATITELPHGFACVLAPERTGLTTTLEARCSLGGVGDTCLQDGGICEEPGKASEEPEQVGFGPARAGLLPLLLALLSWDILQSGLRAGIGEQLAEVPVRDEELEGLVFL